MAEYQQQRDRIVALENNQAANKEKIAEMEKSVRDLMFFYTIGRGIGRFLLILAGLAASFATIYTFLHTVQRTSPLP